MQTQLTAKTKQIKELQQEVKPLAEEHKIAHLYSLVNGVEYTIIFFSIY